MTDAPERIWVWPDYNDHYIPFKQDWTHGFWDSTDEDSLGTEYVRVDRIKAQAAEIKRLRGNLERGLSVAKEIEMACRGLRDEAQPMTAKDATRLIIAELTGGKNDDAN